VGGAEKVLWIDFGDLLTNAITHFFDLCRGRVGGEGGVTEVAHSLYFTPVEADLGSRHSRRLNIFINL
jgi:hypothetical protein